MRAGKKENNSIIQDLEKCINHLHFEIKRQKHINDKQHNEVSKYTTDNT